MHKFVAFNHQICTSEDVFLSAVSSSSLYGRGIFTTIAIYDSQLFQWEKHWDRLISNGEQIGIRLIDFSEDHIKTCLNSLIAKNAVGNGRMRLTFFDESPGGIWKPENYQVSNAFLATTADLRNIDSGLKVSVSPFPLNSQSPLVNVKSCNYLENLIAFEEAKERGFDEAIRLNENGEIAGGCMANIFWVKGDKLFTPRLETGALKGTTRDWVLENFSADEVCEKIEALTDADEIFLTSAGIGIAGAAGFLGKEFYGRGITDLVRNRFFKIQKSAGI